MGEYQHAPGVVAGTHRQDQRSCSISGHGHGASSLRVALVAQGAGVGGGANLKPNHSPSQAKVLEGTTTT